MLVLKQNYYLFLLILLFPFAAQAAWTEPTQAPPGGNTALPVYSTGSGQTIDGTLHVGTPGSYATGLQGTGSTNGIQGNSAANALFGNLSASGAGGNRAVYGLAVDAGDYAAWLSGGLGLGFASGDIWFLQQDAGIAWPRESDGQSLYGVYVNSSGELQVRGHGGGINFMDQNLNSRMTISEAGAVNAVNSLTVGGTPVCLQNGIGCPTITIPTLQQVTDSGNTTNDQIRLTPLANVEALRIISSNYSPIVARNSSDSADLFRVDQNGNGGFSGTVSANVVSGNNVTAGGQNVCRQDGTNCPAQPATYWAPNGNDIYSTNSGAVKIQHGLQFDSYSQAQNYIDFDPLQGSLGNYLLIKSGLNPTYGERWQTRFNRTGETLMSSDLFIGNNNSQGVAVMTPYDNPTVNTAWAIRGKNTPTIEAVPGGGVGSVGDINLKSGTLKLKYLNSDAGDVMLNDTLDIQYGIKNSTADNGGAVYVPDYLKVTEGGAFGGYDPDALIKVTTPTLFAEQFLAWTVGQGGGAFKGTGTINAQQLCIQGDCKASWSAVATSAGWTKSGSNVYLTSSGDVVGIGTASPDSNVKMQINPPGSTEGLRIVSASNWSPLNIRNSNDTADIFRVDQSGNMIVSGTNNKIAGATMTVPLAVKTNSGGYGVTVQCTNCGNYLNLFAGSGYSALQDGLNGPVTLQPNWPTANGGYVGIGTTAPNKQLHIKTYSGNAEFDIQSANSAYWAMYQDDGTDQLRFWNNNVTSPPDKNVLTLDDNGYVGIGTINPSRRFHVYGDMGGNPGEYLMIIESPNDGANLALVTDQASGDYNVVGFRRGSVTGTGWNVGMNNADNTFRIQSRTDGGSNTDRLTIDINSGAVDIKNSLCFNGTCKSGWGPNYGDTFERSMTTPGGGELFDCSRDDSGSARIGYVMVGVRNTSPGKLVCARMW